MTKDDCIDYGSLGMTGMTGMTRMTRDALG